MKRQSLKCTTFIFSVTLANM